MTRRQLESRLRHRVSRDPLLRDLRRASSETSVPVWLVGGYVRDAALGRQAEDLDLAAGRRTVELVRRLERFWGRRGFRFRKRGVTTWRLVVEGRRIDIVDAGHRGIEKDLRRRELTVNAIAFDLGEACLLDPLAGLKDLRAGRLRPTGPGVMGEDPVRALRAARFLAQLPAFRLLPDGRRQALAAAPRLRRASAERIREELDRLLGSRAPGRGLEAIVSLGLLPHVLPELVPLGECIAGGGRPDVWRHTLDAVEWSTRVGRLPAGKQVREKEARLVLRWALLLHDISKPETLAWKTDGKPTFHGHEELGAKRAGAVLRRLRAPSAFRLRVQRLIRHHLRPGHLADASAPLRGMRRLVREAGEDLPLLVLHAACDARSSGAEDAPGRWSRLRRVLLRLLELHEDAVRNPMPRLLGGREVMAELGLQEGREVGQILARLRELQEEGAVTDRASALAFLRSLRRDSP